MSGGITLWPQEPKGLFRRFKDMCGGLGAARGTREHGDAVIELQRLVMAPAMAILFVAALLGVLIVTTDAAARKQRTIEIVVAQLENDADPLEEMAEEEPPDEPPPEPPPMDDVEIAIDNPMPGPAGTLAPVAPSPALQVSVKPAALDAVAFVNSPVKMKSMVGSRTPGSIGAATRGGRQYGDASTEIAVYAALRWLKKTRRPDGSWQGTAPGTARSAAGATGLALLAFLAHGETPKSKEFGPTVKKAIEWLVAAQERQMVNGELVWTCKAHGIGEYGFLIASYALCEAYGMTRNPNVKEAARRALERIVSHQSPTGGWNYYLCRDAKITANGKPDDVSYGGWCIQAIKAGALAGIRVDGMDACIKKAVACLKKRNSDKTLGFAYRPDNRSMSSGLAGVGCLALQFLGYGREPEAKAALDVMRNWKPGFDWDLHPHPGTAPWDSPQYYYYYATQCKFQAGMARNARPADLAAWEEWNRAMKAFYPHNMKDAGEIPGPDGKPRKCAYWVNKDAPNHTIRPVMDTCLVALQLMVYYRYLPQATLKAKDDRPKGAAAAVDKANDIDVSVDI